MKHCIIAKFNESAADKQAALAQVRALLRARSRLRVCAESRFTKTASRDNRYDLMIVVEMERPVPNWDASDSSPVEGAVRRAARKESDFRLRRLKDEDEPRWTHSPRDAAI
ncbi:MAG: hypothetical protein ACLUI3_07925 [Christensenellales bacterium]